MKRAVLLTGAKRIGYEIAKSLLQEGYNLSIVYRKPFKGMSDLKLSALKSGSKILFLKADLENPSCWESIVEKTFRKFSRIDAFLHLASPYRETPIRCLKLSDLKEHITPTAESFFFLSLYSFKKMLLNKGYVKGRIIAFGDWAVDHTPYRNFSAYFLSKGSLHSAVKILAKEFAPEVLVNCIALGPTLKAENLSEEEWNRILLNTPLRREVAIRDIVSLTLFLLKAESITGEIIKLDGGRHLSGSGT